MPEKFEEEISCVFLFFFLSWVAVSFGEYILFHEIFFCSVQSLSLCEKDWKFNLDKKKNTTKHILFINIEIYLNILINILYF